jgi:hypothetical protein
LFGGERKEERMGAQFIRVLRERDDAEILINLNNISKIEVKYAVRGDKEGSSGGFSVSLKEGMANAQAFRVYTIFVGGSEYRLGANPGSRVMQVLEEIYKNAIRDD